MNEIRGSILTIGHSTHNRDHFVALLHQYSVTALADVRSIPYSRANPQFNREELKDALRNQNIQYVFLGKELGGRSDNPACYEAGRVRYDWLARTPLFWRGVERIQQGIKKYVLAVMCAEKEPLECHRAILISRHLITLGIEVKHIHSNGLIESHPQAMSRLAHMLKIGNCDMFRNEEDLLSEIYRRQEQRIAYTLDLSRFQPRHSPQA